MSKLIVVNELAKGLPHSPDFIMGFIKGNYFTRKLHDDGDVDTLLKVFGFTMTCGIDLSSLVEPSGNDSDKLITFFKRLAKLKKKE